MATHSSILPGKFHGQKSLVGSSPGGPNELEGTEHTLHVLLLWFRCEVVSDSFATPCTVARQAPLSMGFPRQEYWSGFPFPSPGDLSYPGIKHAPPALADGFFTIEPPGKPMRYPFQLWGDSLNP